jgi:hypothetical protein
VPSSTGNQDPSVGIGQNNVGKPVGGTTPANGNTVYLGWISGDGHPHIAHSADQGATWLDDTDVGSSVVNVDGTTGIRHAVFPVVVTGDDNRASFGFLGTGDGISTDGNPCDPYGATLNCGNIWHAYIATTYDGGAHWATIDTTPNKAVQKGTICLQGTFCAGGRNLLDFNDFTVDSQGRGLMGYADGVGATGNNAFDGQSGGALPAVARQSGGQRLFTFFDIPEPHAPAAPQALSDNRVTGGILVKWLTPDNGGSTITSYKIYRGTTSGGENTVTAVGQVTGETTNEFFDTTVNASGNYFYHITAVNASGESGFCNEPGVVISGGGSPCAAPYVNVDGAGAAGNVPTDPTSGEMTIERVNIGEPFTSCTDNSITFVMKVQTMDPGATGMATVPVNGEWQILFGITDTLGRPQKVFVSMDTQGTVPTPEFTWGRQDTSATGGTLDTAICTQATPSTISSCPTISGSVTADGFVTIKLNVAGLLDFGPAPTGTTGAAQFSWDARNPGTILGPSSKRITGNTFLLVGPPGVGGLLETIQTTTGGTYTRVGNAFCQTGLPIAVLTGSPLSGTAPLAVTFNGTGSHEPTGACGTINSYTIDFGDGSATVTNSTGMFTHTYTGPPGDYPARLKVQDTAGLTSTNPAQVVITINGGIPPLNGVVSRKTHSGLTPPPTGPGDLVLNSDPTAASTIEPRAGGNPNGNQTLVFSFVNTPAVGGGATATVVTTTGGMPQAILQTNITTTLSGNLYTVAITGVPNASHLSVTLHGVTDSVGNGPADITQKMDVLWGDVNQSGRVDGTDVSLVRQQNFQPVNNNAGTSNYLDDVNISGRIDGTDVSIARQQNFTVLP